MLPPSPWARFEDGERLGWTASWRLWKSFLFPYRTAEFLDFDEETLEMNLGPWKWHAPDWWRRRG